MKVVYLSLILLCTACHLGTDSKKTTVGKRPNIIIFYVDDLGYADLSSYGAKGVYTPNVDRLVEKGIKFTDAHSPAATCTPSRYSLLTGEYAFRNKARKKPYDTLNWPLNKMTLGHYRHDENGHVTYAAMVSKMDADIGLLIQKLKENGQLENTLILFTSDNGHEYDNIKQEFFNSNGMYRGMKRDLYDGGVHVPFVAFWPAQIQPRQTTEHLAAFWDVKATFAELAGVTLTEATDGVSFLPTLLGAKQLEQHDFLYWEFNEVQGPIQAVLKDSWKLLYFVETSVYELYNLEEDPAESNNLIGTQPVIFNQLKEKMIGARTPSEQFPLTRRPNPWKK